MILGALIDAGVALDLATRRAAIVSGVRYELSLSIPEALTSPLTGKMTIRFDLKDASAPLVLDFETSRDHVKSVEANGKPVAINQHIGRRPVMAFGNSNGDKEMLEYTQGGSGARFMLLVLHDDAAREYAYGLAQGLPDTKLGAFTPAIYEQTKKDGWTVVSMKDDWKHIFAFEK